MLAERRRDGGEVHPLMDMTLLPTKYSVPEVSDKSM
jgi:hypothetical protein